MSRVIIVGSGPAGLRAAASLNYLGHQVTILEKENRTGGKLAAWDRLFPAFTPANELLHKLEHDAKGVRILHSTEVTAVGQGKVAVEGGEEYAADAVIVATGFDLFEAGRKEEYGYGIYDNVVTSADLEKNLRRGKVLLHDGTLPARIALLHCVGSRDEKVGQRHCSKVCCITGVKQAIELKRLYPGCEVYNFYMDIRMFGPGYEELYREAQEEYNIQFIRGRISEASETMDKKVSIKAEDTLLGRPLRITVDMLVLLVGMTGCRTGRALAQRNMARLAPNGFVSYRDPLLGCVASDTDGVFYAGCVTAPKNISECLNEGDVVAIEVDRYLRNKRVKDRADERDCI